MKHNPLVSVIIPCYNGEEYIEETLASVFNQTFISYEVIVVDDGSTDESLKILEKFKDRVVLISKTNEGEAIARNTALKAAKGKYIAFLDADDLWKPQKLELQFNYMESNSDCFLSYTDAERFHELNGKKEVIRELRCNLEGYVFKELFWNNFVPLLTVMIRKEILAEIGLFDERPELRLPSDYDFWLRVARIHKIGHLPEILAYHRIHRSNILGTDYEKLFKTQLSLYKKFYSLYGDTQLRVGLSLNECLGDVYLRYSYKNLLRKEYRSAFIRATSSIRYNICKSLQATYLVLTRNSSSDKWKGLLWNFEVCNTILRS